ncbi:cofactor of BRCA1-domain-containing protein [Piptocephalis cylindrospora]|uniref:Cofactor of BRCA1-domain-containing protein n=1 Tax=Piptocephalis cylindrospora TaxID=1907219 RepID=A0A4P9Y2T5_9FUNG|nr:cofactor of BRCA1-domain-containing protein [Piptocephalis cylindrospora]|eukprot:RKP13177.1 cofactor of BRCA1-domain-containing protein [Piptocephalis cylindrospora]
MSDDPPTPADPPRIRPEDLFSTPPTSTSALPLPPSSASPYLVNHIGTEHIQRALSSEAPDTFVPTFAKKHCLQEDLHKKLTPIDPLLVLFGVPRSRLLQAAIDRVVVSLGEQAEEMEVDEERFLALAHSMLPYIAEPNLQNIPLALFAKHPEWLSDSMLDRLAPPQVYSHCPLPIRRRLWSHDKKLHARHLAPIIQAYLDDPGIRSLAREMRTVEFTGSLTARLRRDHPSVRTLVTEVGGDVQLYSEILSTLRSILIKDPEGSPTAAMLRVDLLNSLHDADVRGITENDACHPLAWGLQPCVREGEMSPRQCISLKGVFEGIDSAAGTGGLYGDVATIMVDPFTTHLFAANALLCLRRYAMRNRHSEVRACREIRFASSMINLGAHARKILRTQDFRLPRPPKALNAFFEAMVRIMHVDARYEATDRPRSSTADADADVDRQSGGRGSSGSIGSTEGSGASSDHKLGGLEEEEEAVKVLRSSRIAQTVLAQYVLDRLHARDVEALSHLLPTILSTLPRELGGTGVAMIELDTEILRSEADLGIWSIYESLAISMSDALARTHLAVLLAPSARTRTICVERFLLPMARVSWPVHEAMLRLVAKVYDRGDKTAEYGIGWGRVLGEEGRLPPDSPTFPIVPSGDVEKIAMDSALEHVAERKSNLKQVYQALLDRSKDIHCELTPSMAPRIYEMVYGAMDMTE